MPNGTGLGKNNEIALMRRLIQERNHQKAASIKSPANPIGGVGAAKAI
jgi:hypothetical protein